MRTVSTPRRTSSTGTWCTKPATAQRSESIGTASLTVDGTHCSDTGSTSHSHTESCCTSRSHDDVRPYTYQLTVGDDEHDLSHQALQLLTAASHASPDDDDLEALIAETSARWKEQLHDSLRRCSSSNSFTLPPPPLPPPRAVAAAAAAKPQLVPDDTRRLLAQQRLEIASLRAQLVMPVHHIVVTSATGAHAGGNELRDDDDDYDDLTVDL